MNNMNHKGAVRSASGIRMPWYCLTILVVLTGLVSSAPAGAYASTTAGVVAGTHWSESTSHYASSVLPARSWTAVVAELSGIVPVDVATSKPGIPQDVVNSSLNVASLPQVVAVVPNGQTAYALGYDNSVYPYNLVTNTVEAPISLPVGSGANNDNLVAIAIAPNGKTAYVADAVSSVIIPIDLSTQQAGTPIGLGSDQGTPITSPGGIAISPDGTTVWVNADGNADDVLVPIDVATASAGAPVIVTNYPEAESVAITPDGKAAYVVNYQNGVIPVTLATGAVGSTISLGSTDPEGIAISPDGSTAWVTESLGGTGSGAVAPIDLATGNAGTSITDPSLAAPAGIAFAPDGQSVYVGNNSFSNGGSGDNYVTVISAVTKTVTATVDISSLGEKQADSVAISPDQAPVAKLSVTPEPAGQATTFDASASTVAVGSIVSYAWNFGDGKSITTTSPTTSHVYASAGSYTATVTETDSAGTSTTQVFTGSTVSLNGGPSAMASQSVTVPAVGPVASGISPDFGPMAGGTAVTITGSGFAPGATVNFGSGSASGVNVSSPSEITAVSPAGIGTVDVRVTVAGQESIANAKDRFAYVSPPAPYHSLPPARICDTRANNPSKLSGGAAQCNGQSIASGTPLTIAVAGLGGVPSAGATAAVLNVTVTGPRSAGYLSVYPAGQAPPMASNLNFSAGETVPNLVEVVLSSTGKVSLFSSATRADAVVDVEGYVGPASGGSVAGLYNPLPPARICDTRANNPSRLSGGAAQCNGQTLQAGVARGVNVEGVGGVPSSGVEAVAVNVTVTKPTAAGFLTVYPAGQSRPTASNLNFSAGETVANRVIVPVGASGQIAIYANAGSVEVVVDVGGWYTDGSGSASGSMPFTAMAPSRICDTRSGSGEPDAGNNLGPGSVLTVQVAGIGGVPSMGTSSAPTAAVVNVTAVGATAPSYLTVYPGGTARPTASDLNLQANETVPNLVVVKLGTDGSIDIYNFSGSLNVVVDVVGWYS
ncbi:MAG: PKD domain-containing protein [Acidimicrobiales bacterium]